MNTHFNMILLLNCFILFLSRIIFLKTEKNKQTILLLLPSKVRGLYCKIDFIKYKQQRVNDNSVKALCVMMLLTIETQNHHTKY